MAIRDLLVTTLGAKRVLELESTTVTVTGNETVYDSAIQLRTTTGTFPADPVCEGVANSFQSNTKALAKENGLQVEAIGGSTTVLGWNAGISNTYDTSIHNVGMWFKSSVVNDCTCIFEEGGTAINFAMLVGIGLSITFSAAASGKPFLIVQSLEYAQANRPYFVVGAWLHASDSGVGGAQVRLYVNGKFQGGVTLGNTDAFPNHSGNITIGNTTENLASYGGGTVGCFAYEKNINLLFVIDGSELTEANTREIFERTVLPEVTIAADTVANQQASLDALIGNSYIDFNCAIRILQATDATNYRLFVDDITFKENTNLDDISIQFVGTGILTLEETNGTIIHITSAPSEIEQTASTLTGGGSIAIVNNTLRLTADTTLTNSTATKVVFDGVGTTYTLSGGTVSELENVTGSTVTVTLTNGAPIPSVTGDITINAETADLTVTSNESGTFLQVFATGTQTVLASTTGTTLTYTHSSNTVDIVAQKSGFLPQRITGVVLSGNITQAFTLTDDFNYESGHGLVYTTDASWSRANNELTVPNFGPTVRQVYSLMIDAFIAQSSLFNTPFNLTMNGPTSLLFIDDAEGATDGDIENMTGGGVRYLSGAGVVTSEFVGVQSQGVVAGSQPRYELGVGSTIASARVTGNVNEIIKAYGDATHGNFDYRGNLQFKVQRNGYRQAEADVLVAYGIATLEPTLYIITLTMSEIVGLTLGDPVVTGLTLTDNSGSPVSWDAGDGAKLYSITLTDTGTNTGENVLRWLNYNLSLTATFQGKDPFYWPEIVLDNGPAYETLRGILHGNPDVVAGVRVIDGSNDPHPDFTRFQANDGTYGTPPTVANVSITGILTGSKVRIYNVTTTTETFIGTPGTSYSATYTDGTTYTAGDSINVRIHKRGRLTFETTVVASASGWSVVANQLEDEVYTDLAIDGSLVTGFAADYLNLEVNVTVASNFNIADFYAWWSYNLESDDGIRDFVGGITAIDVGNFRINDVVVDLYIDNTTATNLRQLDNRRIFRADEAYPVKSSGGGGIDIVWRNTVLIAETGVSGLTPSESAQLSEISNITVDLTTINNGVKKASLLIPHTDDV
jgi:xanthosine utilization system XapX-like protein